MTKELTIESHFLFEQPIKVGWSDYHNQMVVLGLNLAYLFDPDTFEVKPFQSTEGSQFKDVSINKDGSIALLLQSDVADSGEIKILSPNLFSIKNTIRVFGYILKFSKFTEDGNLIVVAESSVQSADSEDVSSKIIFIDWKNGQIGEGLVVTNGVIVGLEINSENKSFAISKGGDVLLIPTKILDFDISNDSESSMNSSADTATSESSLDIIRFEPKIIGNIGPGVSSFSIGLKTVSLSNETQKKVRVFVGSRPWQNDRWDSQEVEAQETNILYGGGDNLIPGRSYWVHVSVWHEGSGWARPQIRKFTMPYRYYEDSSSESSESTKSSSSSSSSSSTHIMTTSSSKSSASSASSSSESSVSSSSISSSSISSSSSKSSSSKSSSSISSSSMSSSSTPSSPISYEGYEGSIMAITGGGELYTISYDYGQTWTNIGPLFMSGEAGGKVLMSGDGVHQSVCCYRESAITSQSIYVSTDSGGTFNKVYDFTSDNNWRVQGGGISINGKYQSFVAGTFGQITVVSSDDYGSIGSWTTTVLGDLLGTEYNIPHMFMSNDGRIRITATQEKIFRSEDFGVSWIDFPNTLKIEFLSSSNDTDLIIGHVKSLPDNGSYVSYDLGDNWTKIANLPGNGLTSGMSSIRHKYVFIGDGSTLFISSDNMNSWVSKTIPGFSNWYSSGVEAVSGSGKYFLTTGNTGSGGFPPKLALVSSNYCQTFQEIPLGTTQVIHSFALSSGAHIIDNSSSS